MIPQLRFPSDMAIAAEEAALFRGLSAAERIDAIRSTLSAGQLLLERSPRREFLDAYRRQQEELARVAIRAFVERHGQHP